MLLPPFQTKTVVSQIKANKNPNLEEISVNTNKILNSDQIEHSPPSKKCEKGKVTAVMALAKYDQARHHKSSKKATKEKLIRVLLDSGSDGDLLFHEKGKTKHFPYLTRQVPCSWHTSNGVFQTKGRGKLTIKFFEYSNSKEFQRNQMSLSMTRRWASQRLTSSLGATQWRV